jgi:XTP/dITP diphosphohydrolase
MKIFIASGNQNKITEITEIIQTTFPRLNLELSSIKDLNLPEPAEPYTTFMENACYKAKHYANFTQAPTLSEDAGLCIESLDNFPGVYTKDFLIKSGSLTDAFNNLKDMLKGQNNYTAHFVCAAALYLPSESRFITYEGKDNGQISFPPRGEQCFGFDPIFAPQGYTQTMAELGNKIKNAIGHRAIAIRGIVEQLLEQNIIS